MFARLDRKEIDRHFTYVLSIVQANVHVRDLIEKAFSEQHVAMEFAQPEGYEASTPAGMCDLGSPRPNLQFDIFHRVSFIAVSDATGCDLAGCGKLPSATLATGDG